jgi:hypothetical protein
MYFRSLDRTLPLVAERLLTAESSAEGTANASARSRAAAAPRAAAPANSNQPRHDGTRTNAKEPYRHLAGAAQLREIGAKRRTQRASRTLALRSCRACQLQLHEPSTSRFNEVLSLLSLPSSPTPSPNQSCTIAQRPAGTRVARFLNLPLHARLLRRHDGGPFLLTSHCPIDA